MARAQQQRTLKTRARLIAASEDIIEQRGFENLRVEDVVSLAGTAKGTFFTHFKDKDALMDLIIGGMIDQYLDTLEAGAVPNTVQEMVGALLPLCNFMISERYVFDLILRHSGAAAKEEIGPIAQTFDRQVKVLAQWLSDGRFRKDVPAMILAEGIQAFAVQCMALHFCAINSEEPMQARFSMYLDAWLNPKMAS